jgi:hypothetical protein
MTADQAVAPVLPMPGNRIVMVRRLPYQERVRLLEKLAREYQWLEPVMVTIIRDALCHDSLTGPQVDEWWAQVLHHIKLAHDGQLGCLDYRQVDPDLTCDDRTSVAIEIAISDAAAAIAVLAGGIR